MLADPASSAVFIAVSEDRAAGFLEVTLRNYAEGASSSPVPFIEGWFVLTESRNQGFGRALIQAAEAWAVSHGYHEIGSDTQIDNGVAIEAHRRLGYTEIERQVCFLKTLKRHTE